jgi:hypothetical protein
LSSKDFEKRFLWFGYTVETVVGEFDIGVGQGAEKGHFESHAEKHDRRGG